METVKTKPDESKAEQELGDETFMSAADLRNYMTEMQMAQATKSVDGMDRADKARKELVKRLAEPVDLTPERLKEILQPLRAKLRSAAERGQTELMVMRFPNGAVHRQGPRDQQRGSGLARNPHRPAAPSLRAVAGPAQARRVQADRDDHRWPGGLPGDVGFFLKWGDDQAVALRNHVGGRERCDKSDPNDRRTGTDLRTRLTELAHAQSKVAEVYQERCTKAVQRYIEAVEGRERAMAGEPIRSASPLDFWRDASAYWLDFTQRSILFWDTLRQRGNNWIEHEKAGKPPLLAFDWEMIADARTFERPVELCSRADQPAGGRQDRSGAAGPSSSSTRGRATDLASAASSRTRRSAWRSRQGIRSTS